MKYLYSSCIIAIGLTDCASMVRNFTEHSILEAEARKHYQQGDYDQAVFKYVRSLKFRPSYEKAQILLQSAYPVAVETHERKIRSLHNARAPMNSNANGPPLKEMKGH